MSNSKSLAIHNLFVFIRVSSEMIFSHIFVVFFSLAVPLFDVDGQQHSNPNENIKHQSYNFMYDLSNGVKRKETVEWNEGSKDGLNIYGSYEYAVGETLVQVMYVADKDGFRPQVRIKQRKESDFPVILTRLSPAALATLSGGGLG
ncbi:flexible cuticle protein 12-like isoform X1 [Rhynchophorus ferrugineus]|uniref:flexible cuticle protein 12-like isoform X1 n=1 Tax=Rhynchophorus ferrugineus TaxID=354439 RepID=UPI003FCC6384